MSEIKKLSKWDMKKAVKLLGLDWNDETEKKVKSLAGLAEESAEPETKLGQGLLKALTETLDAEEANDVKRVTYDIVHEGKKHKLLEITFRVGDARLLLESDSEPKCIMEMQKRMSARRMKELKVK